MRRRLRFLVPVEPARTNAWRPDRERVPSSDSLFVYFVSVSALSRVSPDVYDTRLEHDYASHRNAVLRDEAAALGGTIRAAGNKNAPSRFWPPAPSQPARAADERPEDP
jgi:hypothetical protein